MSRPRPPARPAGPAGSTRPGSAPPGRRRAPAAVLLLALLLTPGIAAAQVTACEATGGTVTSYVNGSGTVMVVHTFAGSGTFTIAGAACTVEVLVVAGGGGGGVSDNGNGGGGGGGGGGLVYQTLAVGPGSFPVTVGAGGSANGGSGGNSVFAALTALGGGGGQNDNAAGTSAGGSGGGGRGRSASTGGSATQPGSASGGFGNAGGNGDLGGPNNFGGGAGGGGGAGSAGGNASVSTGGAGGSGRTYSITGTAQSYGGGGGGGGDEGFPGGTATGGGGAGGTGAGTNGTVGTAGTANTGGGGGGGGSKQANNGGAGGSGVVIIAYAAPACCVEATGGTVTDYTQDGVNYRAHTFTASGTLTVTAGGTVEVLVVGGGGGGGVGATNGVGAVWGGGGGGGAGGMLYSSAAVTAQAYGVTVGSGGDSQQSGGNSTFGSVTALGGGRGGDWDTVGTSGGSGGGGGGKASGGTGTSGQGSNGGVGSESGAYDGAAGGGGKGAAGGSASGGTAGNGGAGTISTITGVSVTYAGGGGGGGQFAGGTGGSGVGGNGGHSGSQNGADGAISTGSGGGGAGGSSGLGGKGGSGIVIVRYQRSPVAAGFRFTQSGGGIYCLDHGVVVTALDAGGAPVAGYGGTVQLSTGSGRGTWLLASGGGTLTDGTPDDGLATYAWNPADTSVGLQLRYRAGPGTVTLDATDLSNATITDDNASTGVVFSPDGFTVTAAPFTNPAGGVPPFASPQVAGAAFAVYLTAYGQTPTDPQCGIIADYAGARNLRFWSTWVNPATGSLAASINGSAIATSEAASVPQAVTFTAGQAVVTARYRDAGALAISVKDDTTGNPALPTGIRGSTGPVVVRPADFQVSNIRRTSDAAANPGAGAASGPVFIGAGQPFSATVQAVDVDGNPTPNFGQEFPAEAVAFTPTLVLPAGGNLAAVTGTATGFANGQATGTGFGWPEVGIIRLVPRVADGDYLGAGAVTGNPTGNVGRFIPDRFGVATNTPLFATGCLTGGFTYRGQPFGYAVAPVITATAQAADGSTTLNYAGDFFRLTAAAVGSPAYASTGGNLDTSGLPAAGADPVIAATGPGVATLTFSAGSGLALARGAPAAPVDAVISLTSPVVDLDGAAAAGPVTFGASGGIAFTAGASQRYGRLALRNALGSELLDLPVRLTTEFYAGDAQGFMTHTADSCTVAPPLTLGGYQGALAAGETCVRDTGAPGVSGAGCAAPAPVGQRYRATAQAGGFNLHLAAPGAGNQGAATVTGDAPPFLEYDWNTATPGLEDPAAFATFGVFPGPASRIYQREVY